MPLKSFDHLMKGLHSSRGRISPGQQQMRSLVLPPGLAKFFPPVSRQNFQSPERVPIVTHLLSIAAIAPYRPLHWFFVHHCKEWKYSLRWSGLARKGGVRRVSSLAAIAIAKVSRQTSICSQSS